jgi:predicted transcriptional regulator
MIKLVAVHVVNFGLTIVYQVLHSPIATTIVVALRSNSFMIIFKSYYMQEGVVKQQDCETNSSTTEETMMRTNGPLPQQSS